MEPVFMILGQSSAIAGDMALATASDVREIDRSEFRRRLEAAGQHLLPSP
jgi:hypothetical protein